MPSLEAFTLVGKSSKCSSRGSEGRTRTSFAILARRLLRASVYSGPEVVATGLSLESFDTRSVFLADNRRRIGLNPNSSYPYLMVQQK